MPTRELSPGGGKTGKLTTLNKAYRLCSSTLLEKLSEKGAERGLDRRFGRYTNAKVGRKVPFQYPQGFVVGAARDFSTVSRVGIAGSLVGTKRAGV